ncbi:CopY/TcrY family copper transport repressor [Oenococcus alcoholitolerans]|uniref:CopY/TcrY family copper transport repressor n=1 Tax=Oenococcus alcoholitolerans TaxID=931074 RepID=UPI003F713FF2
MTNVDKRKETISPAEWQVMRIVWTLGGVNSQELVSIMDQKFSWSPSTTKTLMKRLEKKSFLKDDGASRGRVYKALIPETTAMFESAEQLFDSICAMHVGDTLASVIKNHPLSIDDISKLERLLEEKKADAPKMIACDCLPKGMKGKC